MQKFHPNPFRGACGKGPCVAGMLTERARPVCLELTNRRTLESTDISSRRRYMAMSRPIGSKCSDATQLNPIGFRSGSVRCDSEISRYSMFQADAKAGIGGAARLLEMQDNGCGPGQSHRESDNMSFWVSTSGLAEGF